MNTFRRRHIKKNEIYYASNEDLKIRDSQGNIIPGGHNVIVTSVNNKKGTCRVKTITSLEEKVNGQWKFKQNKLRDVREGKILVVPKNQIRTHHLSGINHSSKSLKQSKLRNNTTSSKFPKRYEKLIHKK